MLIFIFFLTLLVGILGGWIGAERYMAFMAHVEHDYEELFTKNPHPELFQDDGKIYRGDYTAIQFEPGFDPEEFDPETDIIVDEDH